MDWSNDCIDSHLNNIGWRYCFFIITFYHLKGYQEGVNRKIPCNIYYNPLSPEYFPVLNFDNYVLLYPTLIKGDFFCPLGIYFFVVFLKNVRMSFSPNVYLPSLGYHSALKGAAMLCASIWIVAPPITSICIHAGWYILNVNIFYLRYEVSGDTFRVRVISGLNPVTYETYVSCCYFETTDEMSAQLETYLWEVVVEANL